ncbi:ERCC4 domain-containing protein [Tissierella praeacuta]|uniref:ERCC4 domain-containing protein n=1 Tax=Tissierella praeacuta TaxID=43131 RepID=UPI003DA237A4
MSTNFTKERDRLKNEFAQHKGKMFLIIEGAYENICEGNYKSQYNKDSYVASLHSMSNEFDIPIIFMPNKDYTAHFIYKHLYYYVRTYIK